MSEVLDRILRLLNKGFTSLVGLAAIVIAAFNEVADRLFEATTKFAVHVGEKFNLNLDFSSSGVDLNIINTLFPLKEAWLLTIVYFTYCSGILLIRWIKSIIPTVSN